MWPAIALPAETPIPKSVSPEHVDQLVVQLAGGSQRRAGGIGMLDRGTEDGQRRVTLELVDEAAVPVDRVDDDPEEVVEQADDVGGRPGRGQLGRADQVDEQHGHVALLAAEFGAAFERAASDVLADVAAEQVTQPLPLGQVAHHVVETGLQQPELAGVVDLHVGVVVAALHLAERPAQLAQRVGDGHRHQDGAGQTDHQGGDREQQDRRGEPFGGGGQNLELAGHQGEHNREDGHAGGQHPRQHLAQDDAGRVESLRYPAAQGGDGDGPQARARTAGTR